MLTYTIQIPRFSPLSSNQEKICPRPILKAGYVIVRVKGRIVIQFLRTSNYPFIMYVVFCIYFI